MSPAPADSAAAPARASEMPARRHHALTIADGHGGGLSLDLRRGDVLLLADACRRLTAGAMPEGASAIKVRAAETCYLVSRAALPAGEPSITVLNLFDPSQRVQLAGDLAATLAALIEDGVALSNA